MTISHFRVFALAALTTFGAQPALAHHVMGGAMPQTFVQGLLSGLGHPIIGLDHLAAIIAVGTLAALIGRGFALALAFTAALIIGVGLHLWRANLPAAELLVGLSTAVVGLVIAFRMTMGVFPIAALFAMAGLAHGYALAESIVGAEVAPLGAYLIGLLTIQTILASGAFAATRVLLNKESSFGSASVTGVGALITLVGGVAIVLATGVLV
jgi:urease accessory protein